MAPLPAGRDGDEGAGSPAAPAAPAKPLGQGCPTTGFPPSRQHRHHSLFSLLPPLFRGQLLFKGKEKNKTKQKKHGGRASIKCTRTYITYKHKNKIRKKIILLFPVAMVLAINVERQPVQETTPDISLSPFPSPTPSNN